jgi:acetyl-CoA acyltransferase
MSDNVYVIGTDMIRFGRFEDATPPSLAAKAA